MYSLLFKVGYKSYSERKQNGVWKYLDIEFDGGGAINFVLFLWWLFLCVVFPIKFIAKHVDLNTIYKPRILVTDELICSSIGCLLNIVDWSVLECISYQ